MRTDLLTTNAFESAVGEISRRFLLPCEFALLPPEPQAEKILDNALDLSEHELSVYAARLDGRQTEQLLLLLHNELDSFQLDALYELLSRRSGKRLCTLFWCCFQYHYTEEKYLKAAKILSQSQSCADACRLKLFLGDGVSALLDKLNSSDSFLASFIKNESLIEKSPLCIALVEKFFETCDAGKLIINGKKLYSLITGFDRFPVGIITNYLDRLNADSYIFDLNVYLLNRFGNPFTSPDWSGIPIELKHKFIGWMAYRKICRHFTGSKLKRDLIKQYIPYMRDVVLYCDDRVMVIDFGDFYIVDDSQTAPFSYYFSQRLYEAEKEEIEANQLRSVRERLIEQGKKQLANTEKTSSAPVVHGRDFIIEEREGEFVQLDYEDVGRLYIKDMLDIILGIQSDLRPSKNIIRKKNRKRR